MSLPPIWKLKREAIRLGQQAAQLPWFVTARYLSARYDRQRAALVTVSRGSQAFAPDVAILLIFQPNGVADSVYATLDHLSNNGFTPVVVSNTAIDQADAERLLSRCGLLIQRPNYGYDFGGYREGILSMADLGHSAENLVILNDSVWFPARPNCQLLETSRADASDLFGIFYNQRERRAHRSHLQSYFYRFGPRATQSAHFLEYWRNLFLTNNKWLVVRQNEMKLTSWFADRGFSINALLTSRDLLSALDSLDDDQLTDVVRFQLDIERSRAPQPGPVGPTNDSPAPDKSGLIGQFNRAKYASYLMNTHPHVLLDKLDVPMIKKDRQPMYQAQRREIVRLGYDRTLTPVVASELRMRDMAPMASGS